MLIRFFLHRLVWLSVLVSLGIGVLVARGLWVAREEVLLRAQHSDRSLSHTLAVGLEWTLGDLDRKVQTMALLLSASELGHDMHVREALQMLDSPLLLINPHGQEVHSQARNIASLDYTQRDFYRAFAHERHQGVFVGEPQRLRPHGPLVLPVARAWRRIDGRLAGLVVGAIPLEQLEHWLHGLAVGPASAIALVRTDGRVLARLPTPASQASKEQAWYFNTDSVHHFYGAAAGVFEGDAGIDAVVRLHNFQQVRHMPVVVDVAQTQAAILLPWQRNVLEWGVFAALLIVGNTALAVLFVRELERRRQVQAALLHEKERMQAMALQDPLTGLSNRLQLQGRAQQALAQAQAHSVALLYLDLDGFKQVNDQLGHEAGDHVLRHIAQQLRQVARLRDTVCRLGGDEFVLLLPDFDPQGLPVLAERVLHACAQPCWWQGQNVQQLLGISGGVALSPQHGTQFEQLLRQADAAMYHAKQGGRGRICICWPDSDYQILAAL